MRECCACEYAPGSARFGAPSERIAAWVSRVHIVVSVCVRDYEHVDDEGAQRVQVENWQRHA